MQLTYLHIHNFKSIRDIDRALILGRALLYLPYHCRRPDPGESFALPSISLPTGT